MRGICKLTLVKCFVDAPVALGVVYWDTNGLLHGGVVKVLEIKVPREGVLQVISDIIITPTGPHPLVPTVSKEKKGKYI
jgi:hypothetical protein